MSYKLSNQFSRLNGEDSKKASLTHWVLLCHCIPACSVQRYIIYIRKIKVIAVFNSCPQEPLKSHGRNMLQKRVTSKTPSRSILVYSLRFSALNGKDVYNKIPIKYQRQFSYSRIFLTLLRSRFLNLFYLNIRVNSFFFFCEFHLKKVHNIELTRMCQWSIKAFL